MVIDLINSLIGHIGSSKTKNWISNLFLGYGVTADVGLVEELLSKATSFKIGGNIMKLGTTTTDLNESVDTNEDLGGL